MGNIIREEADKYQEFFNFMSQEHDLNLTVGQMNDIVQESKRLDTKLSKPLKCDTCKSGLIEYKELNRRTCRCGRLGYNVV